MYTDIYHSVVKPSFLKAFLVVNNLAFYWLMVLWMGISFMKTISIIFVTFHLANVSYILSTSLFVTSHLVRAEEKSRLLFSASDQNQSSHLHSLCTGSSKTASIYEDLTNDFTTWTLVSPVAKWNKSCGVFLWKRKNAGRIPIYNLAVPLLCWLYTYTAYCWIKLQVHLYRSQTHLIPRCVYIWSGDSCCKMYESDKFEDQDSWLKWWYDSTM